MYQSFATGVLENHDWNEITPLIRCHTVMGTSFEPKKIQVLPQVMLWGAAFPSLQELRLCGNHISDIQLPPSSSSQQWAEKLQVLS